MFEKVNPSHPDKVADRIAGAIVDLAYKREDNPKCAVEVLIGHDHCHIIIESDLDFSLDDVKAIVWRIAGPSYIVTLNSVPQDIILADNQEGVIRCGDNGIFKGVPLSEEEEELARITRKLYARYRRDGKCIVDEERGRLIICQSNAFENDIRNMIPEATDVNPLGYWSGGPGVDTGATNRKLGSDMGRAVTGGGLHGKDLSKADVSVNIYAHLKAQITGEEVNLCCAIGDETVDGIAYSEIVEVAAAYIDSIGGFEKFAEWGLI